MVLAARVSASGARQPGQEILRDCSVAAREVGGVEIATALEGLPIVDGAFTAIAARLGGDPGCQRRNFVVASLGQLARFGRDLGRWNVRPCQQDGERHLQRENPPDERDSRLPGRC
jgi:hypothetical protein